ncbi:unnamed protein product [Urochloa humidicola]
MSRSFRTLWLCCWNVQGLGDRAKCNDVKSNLSGHALDVVSLQETKLQDVTFFKACTFLPHGLTSFEFCSSVGTAGGLLTAWNASFLSLAGKTVGEFSLTLELVALADESRLFITNVYAPCTSDRRPAFLAELVRLASELRGKAWLVFGDFNLIRCPDERNNDRFNAAAADAFNSAIDAALLQELPLLDRRFTWTNRRNNPTLLRLDRAFISEEWGTVLFNSKLESLPRPVSDHVPLVVTASSRAPLSTVFRFERGWAAVPGYRALVDDVWARPQNNIGGPVQHLVKCLRWTRAESKKWARDRKRPACVLANCRTVLELLDLLEERRRLASGERLLRTLVEARLSAANKELAAYWKQRFTFRVCKLGDDNTKFFHASASARLRRNHIAVLHDAGVPVYTHQAKERVLHSFYTGLLGTADAITWPTALNTFLPPVPGLAGLDAPFSIDEARDALWHMRLDSSPGPDGFGPAFFRAFWATVKPAVADFLAAFQAGMADLDAVNRAFVVLLPKKEGALTAGDFRPISLQNCAPKIASKIMTTRLHTQITDLVSMLQTGFIKGWCISDNFLFATELVQCCYKRRASTIVLKLDFRKAFDSIDWISLDAVLAARGFGDNWRAMVRSLLSSGKTAVMLNGVPGPWILCRRGLRQGDPLSPYLFLIVDDLLHRMVAHEDSGLEHPLVPGLPCPVIQYADDTLIILPACPVQLHRLKKILDTFASATGLHINFHKSTFVPVHIDQARALELAAILGCPVASFPQTYLGLPLSSVKLSPATLDALSIKAERAFPGWRTSLLTSAGRLTLASAVLTAQSMHAMAVIPLPASTLQKLDRPRKGLFWKGAPKCSGGDCQVAWQLACREVEDGGVGLKDLATLNTSLLLKHIHKLFTGVSNPWTDWMRLWYDEGYATEDTPCWRQLKALIPQYRAMTTVVLGDGRTTSFWHDAWTEVGRLADVLPALYSHCLDTDATVAEVVPDGLLPSALQPRLSAAASHELALLNDALLHVSLESRHDQRVLTSSPSEAVRTGVFYRALRAPSEAPPMGKINWSGFAPKKVKIFFWILRHERTRTRASLHRHGALGSPDCPFCPGVEEDLPHLFVGRLHLAPFWERVLPGRSPPATVRDAAESVVSLLSRHGEQLGHSAALGVLWIIWKRRNRMVFDDVRLDDAQMCKLLDDHLKLWVCRAPRKLDVAPLLSWCHGLSSS